MGTGFFAFASSQDIFSLLVSSLPVLIFITYLVIGGYESSKSFVRNRDNTRWHTYHAGTSRFTFLQNIPDKLGISRFLGYHLINPFILQLFVEPLTAIIASIILSLIAFALTGFLPMATLALSTIAGWLFISAIFMHIKALVLYFRMKKQVLNIRDSKIESQNMSAVLNDQVFSSAMIEGINNAPFISSKSTTTSSSVAETAKPTRPESSASYSSYSANVNPQATSGFTVRGFRPQSNNQARASTQDAIKRAMEKDPELEKKFGGLKNDV